MRVHSTLAAWLPTTREIVLAELLTVTKPSGAVWRYASSVDNVTDGATVYLGSASTGGLIWTRAKLTFKDGIELCDCAITIHSRDTDMVNALTVAGALRARLWDDAKFLVSRAYFDAAGTLKGVLPRYQGQLATAVLHDGDVRLALKPPSQTFNRSVPPVYQASCLNTLFDAGCGVSKAANTQTGSILSITPSTTTTLYTSLTSASGWFSGGAMTFTSGPLTGVSRTIRSHALVGGASGGVLTFFGDWPSVPATGNTFTITPGCDRSLGATGCAKFANTLRFRGTPFIPLPETAM